MFIDGLVFILGASIGSFLNVLIDRLPNNEGINGRSHCDFCKKKIAWYDLFPIVSFFILGGRTRCCKKKMSFQYPLVETITGLSFLLITNCQIPITKQSSITNFQFQNVWLFNNWLLFDHWLSVIGIFSCLIVIFVSDLKYHLISDYILLALFIFSIVYHIVSNNLISLFPYFFISLFIIAFPIWLIYYLSKERAMGLGDVYLAGIIGFLLGWKSGFLALYIAFVTGAVVGVLLMLLQRKKIKSRIAFGPFLALGTVVMLLYGEKVLEMIRKIYGF